MGEMQKFLILNGWYIKLHNTLSTREFNWHSCPCINQQLLIFTLTNTNYNTFTIMVLFLRQVSTLFGSSLGSEH
jgi:hypothetical protein